MQIAVWSNAPWCATGYGTQSKQLIKRLRADGHEVAMIANYGLTGAPLETDGMRVYPQGTHPYSLDVCDLWANHFFGDRDGGLIISLYDVWPIQQDHPGIWERRDAWFWTPIDHAPPPPKVIEFSARHNTIAMSEWGAQQLRDSGVTVPYTIPHGIERDAFRPTDSDIRAKMGLPDGAHLTAAVMANIGQYPVRKSWFENLLAWRIFAEKHPDAYIYIHTQLRHPRGVDLATLIQLWGLPQDRVRIVDQGAYAGGLIDQETLAAIYTAADVTLMATAGEGFGLPAAESTACGTPVIGTDFSAQREVIGDAGWLVPYTTIWDYPQGAAQAAPNVHGIVAALEESYAMSHDRAATDEMRQRCIEHSARFDADRVYAEQWRPFLAAREQKPERKGMSNAARRRAKKAGRAA